MVRLRAESHALKKAFGISFQFQNGTIKRCYVSKWRKRENYFNSKMVRLRGGQPSDALCECGTISIPKWYD